jgi:hypothetical protein
VGRQRLKRAGTDLTPIEPVQSGLVSVRVLVPMAGLECGMITEFVNERFDSLKDPVGAGMSISDGCGSTGGQGLLWRLSSLESCLWEALGRVSSALIFRRFAENCKAGIGRLSQLI